MHAIGNKQYNFRHIAFVELVDDLKPARDPRTGEITPWHVLNIHLANGNVEQILFETADERNAKWEELINAMELAGF